MYFAREQPPRGLVAVSAAPSGIDDIFIRKAFAQNCTVAAKAVDDGGVILRPQHGNDVLASAIFHSERRKASALFVVGVDRREHVAIGMALELAA